MIKRMDFKWNGLDVKDRKAKAKAKEEEEEKKRIFNTWVSLHFQCFPNESCVFIKHGYEMVIEILTGIDGWRHTTWRYGWKGSKE